MGVEEQKVDSLRRTNELLRTIQYELIRNVRNPKFCCAKTQCFQSVIHIAGSKL
jgi:hypothetical protein